MSDEAKTPVPFLDWFELWPGASGYEADGRAFIGEFPTGVKLTVQPPREKRDFEMAEDRSWEGGRLNISTLMHHDGRFRLWYHTQPRGWSGSATCYAESDDGVAWEKPALGLCEFEGSRENNIIDSDLEGHIFVDTNPQAPEAERYKMVGMKGWWKRGGGHMEGAEDEPDALKLRTELCAQGKSEQEIMEEIGLMGNLMGAVSPDGLRWTLLDRPLLEMFCDSDNIVFFDEERKAYVGYFRHNMFRETVPTVWPPNPWRCIGRAETGDFRHWPTPTIVVQPDADDPPTQDVYTNAYAPYPTGKYHIMFPSIYHRGTDVVDTQIAVSRNGITWFRHKDPILKQGPPERNEDGGIYVRHGIFPLDQSHWGVPYICMSHRHNEGYYYDSFDHNVYHRWAVWQRDRFVALEAEVQGQATLLPRVCGGERLLLNCKTEPGGWVRAAFVEPMLWPPEKIKPIQGFGFEDCDPVRGDSLEAEVSFNDNPDLSALKGRNICLCLQICRGRVFSTLM